MAGVSDMVFRGLCFEHGCDFACSEMISAKGLILSGGKSETVQALFELRPGENTGAQLFGTEPDIMAQAAARLSALGFKYIDINMGCPVRKVTANGEGSALMRTPELAAAIVRAVSQAIALPLTVKMRAGWDENHINAPEFAALMERSGADAICVHGRTREQFYSGTADYGVIREVKRAVSVPVTGNGDVTDGASARRMLDETGCDAIAVGRGAQGDPFIFEKIKCALAGRDYAPPSPSDILRTIELHYARLADWRGESVAVREMRKHIAWYLHGLPGSARIKNELLTAPSRDAVFALLEPYLLNL